MDVVDRVAGDRAENGAQAPHDARLFAVRNVVVADNVMADRILIPTVLERALDGLDVALGRVGRRVVPPVAVFPQRDAGADRVADYVVLDDPALAPVGADQADLLRGGRSPRGRGVAHGETAHGDVVSPRLIRIEDRAPDIDFHLLFVGIDPRELRPEGGLLLVHRGKPQRGVCGLRFVTLKHQAKHLDTTHRLDVRMERGPYLPAAGVRNCARAQEFSLRRVQANLDDAPFRCRGGADLDPLGASSKSIRS